MDNIQSSVSHVITKEVAPIFSLIWLFFCWTIVSMIIVWLHWLVIDELIDGWQGQCCGLTGPSDWQLNPYIQNLSQSGLDFLPCSCFNSAQTTLNLSWCSGAKNTTLPHTKVQQHTSTIPEAAGFRLLLVPFIHCCRQGCKTLLHEWLHQNVLTIISMDFGLIFIQVKETNTHCQVRLRSHQVALYSQYFSSW